MYQVEFKFKGEWRIFSTPVLSIIAADRLVDSRSIINYPSRIWNVEEDRQVTYDEIIKAWEI